MKLTVEIARSLLAIQAVSFTPQAPVTFKSGIRSPVYVDNRRLPFHPREWRRVIEGFATLIESEAIEFDVIAGIETAGIPHSAALAYALERPSVFVRKEAKAHGTRSRIEGGDVAGKRVLLIEDLVTTGSSSLSGIAALREANAQVTDCLAIVSYGFEEARAGFETAAVRLHTLTSFVELLAEARLSLPDAAIAAVEDWLRDPYGWAERHL